MTQSHCLQCPAWEEQRAGLDISDIKNLVKFFRRVLDERANLEKGNVSQ